MATRGRIAAVLMYSTDQNCKPLLLTKVLGNLPGRLQKYLYERSNAPTLR